MVTRVALRLLVLLSGLLLATVLGLGALAALATNPPAAATSLMEHDRSAADRVDERSASQSAPSVTTPSRVVVLVFAGIVILAALPPLHRVDAHHRTHWH